MIKVRGIAFECRPRLIRAASSKWACNFCRWAPFLSSGVRCAVAAAAPWKCMTVRSSGGLSPAAAPVVVAAPSPKDMSQVVIETCVPR